MASRKGGTAFEVADGSDRYGGVFGRGAPLRVLIVDDHVLFAESIRHTLEERGIEARAIASTGADALSEVAETGPHVVLIDVGVPEQRALNLGQTIVDKHPHVRVIALAAVADPSTVRQAMSLGFNGYLTKDVQVSTFVDVIVADRGREVLLPEEGSSFRQERAFDEAHALEAMYQLTSREREVLRLLADGASGRAIARVLSISPNTVRSHVQNILTKLQVHSRLEAMAFATRHGLLRQADRYVS